MVTRWPFEVPFRVGGGRSWCLSAKAVECVGVGGDDDAGGEEGGAL